IMAMAISFIFYLGLDFVASSGVPYFLEQILSYFSINNHYLSISRGVVDMRDIIYFIGMTLFFLYITGTYLRIGNWKLRKTKIHFTVFVVSLMSIFFLSTNFLFRADLTADKRFSLSDVSKEILSDNNEIIEIEFFLDGELEPGLQKLQQEVFEKIAVLNVYSPKPIRLKIVDPYRFSNAKKHEDFQSQLIEKGIKPVSFNRKTDEGVSTRYIFPGAIVRLGGKQMAVNFLKNNPDFSYEMNFNHSVENVEFELINSIQNLKRERNSTVAFLEGHGEFNQYEVLDFANALSSDFNVIRTATQAIEDKSEEIEILIVAGPVYAFSEKDKFIVDQFVMHGGKVIWLIDPVQVSLDSLSNGYQTFSFPRNLNLDDQLFKYGVRLNYELLQDVDCAQILVNTAPPGSQTQWTLHPWYYSPLLIPVDNHPLSRNLNRIYTEFVSSVDTVKGGGNISKSVILSTSPYARKVKSPSSVSLENIKNPPARELFSQPFIPVGVLVEGEFSSVFENRMIENLGALTVDFQTKSKPTKMVIIGDAGLIANKVNYAKQPPQIQELGYDRVSKQVFGNKEFLLNTVYYLNDETGIMQLRSRTVQLRLLDKVKLREEKSFWQWLNVVVPLLVVLLFGLTYNLVRRYRYSRS
ncbi:MAG TPA: gliding motility-associated ABC transporter substrate-binding protein GldG, partial [Draconibacterium sp.]|nr:gliding motility-associated ABC transporter substrate-binding protein GldG [Draconibacterium sp.]